MKKYLITFYSGDIDVYNTPVLVHVYKKDEERFIRFLRECGSLSGYGTTFKMIEDIDSYIFNKYFTIDSPYGKEVLFPQDYFNMENTSYVYDEGRYPTQDPASLYSWYEIDNKEIVK